MSRFRQAKQDRRSQKRKAKAKRYQKGWQDYLDGKPEAVARAKGRRRRELLRSAFGVVAMVGGT